MILRVFVFRAKKSREHQVVAFMQREALNLLRQIPACRAAFLCTKPGPAHRRAASRGKGPQRAREYMWVTVWTSELALQSAQKRKDWQRVVAIEEGEYFAGRPRAEHFDVLLRK